MVTKKMHEHEIAIDAELVKELLIEQFPQWASLPITRVQSDGTDNAVYRLGNDMCVRLPRIPQAVKSFEVEQIWLPKLAPLLPLAIPVPLAQGNPTKNYPWHWCIYRWLIGEIATKAGLIDLEQAAIDLAQFISALHQIDPSGGPLSRRGGPLITQDYDTRTAINLLKESIDTQKITTLWEESLAAAAWDKPPVWIHGDLLPSNILIKDRRVTAIIDFDSLGIGDPACDLIPAWSLFDNISRQLFRSKIAVDDATWLRGRGWALSIALIIIPYYQRTNLGLTAVAQRILQEVLGDS